MEVTDNNIFVVILATVLATRIWHLGAKLYGASSARKPTSRTSSDGGDTYDEGQESDNHYDDYNGTYNDNSHKHKIWTNEQAAGQIHTVT